MQSKQCFQFLILTIVMAFLPFGCGASKAMKEKQALVEVQSPIVVTKTGQDKRPDWTSENPFREDDKGLYFSGGIMGGADYALTIRLAKAEATKNLLESIQIKLRSEFSSAIHGQNRIDNDLGRYATDGVAWVRF